MTIIRVPKPPQSALNKDRPVSTLLRNQVKHLQEAEFRLPARAQTNIYINAIKTEAEAAEYIRQVTAKLHAEHAAAHAVRKPKKKVKARKKFVIAAMAKGRAKAKTKRTAPRKKASRS